MHKTLKLLIVGDHRCARQSLRALFATWPAITAIREAVNGAEALRLTEDFRPDNVLIDEHTESMGGLEITQKVKERWPDIGVVILSMYSNLEPGALAVGADAFITKGEPPEVFMQIFEAIADRQEQQGKVAGRSNSDVF